MRIIHTSDWHLGKSFGAVSLRSDQEAFADWFVDLVTDQRPDLVVIAGDIYDRAIAPVESIALFRETLTRLLDLGIVIAAITGNHDAPDRVAPFSDLLDTTGLYLRGGYDHVGEVITLNFADGPLDLVLFPFLDPQGAPDDFGVTTNNTITPPINGNSHHDNVEVDGYVNINSDDLSDVLIARRRARTHESVLADAINMATNHLRSPRSIAVAHAFVMGSLTTDSERQLSVGGTGEVPSSLFDPFSYTALGHLHRPQTAGSDVIRYSGTPIPYSFSEEHQKTVVNISLAPNGAVTTELIPVDVGRRVRTITGSMSELLDPSRFHDATDCFVRAVIEDQQTILDPIAKLSTIYPFITEVQYLLPVGPSDYANVQLTSIRELTPLEATRAFWEATENSPPQPDVDAVIVEAVEHAIRVCENETGIWTK